MCRIGNACKVLQADLEHSSRSRMDQPGERLILRPRATSISRQRHAVLCAIVRNLNTKLLTEVRDVDARLLEDG